MSYDWTQFRCDIFIQAPIEKIFNAWMSETQLTSWFLEKVSLTSSDGIKRKPDEFCEVGDRYEWMWHGAWDYVEKGTIIEIIPNRKIRFSFSQDQVEVELEFVQQEDEVQLILRQFNIPTDEQNMVNVHMGCNLGWSFWMVNLKAWLEHGILLNDRKHRDPHAINQ